MGRSDARGVVLTSHGRGPDAPRMLSTTARTRHPLALASRIRLGDLTRSLGVLALAVSVVGAPASMCAAEPDPTPTPTPIADRRRRPRTDAHADADADA